MLKLLNLHGSVDTESSLLLILESVLLDILPELLGEFCAWEWFGANNCGEFIVWSYWLHECCIRFTLCCHIIFSFNGYDFSPYVVNIAYNTRVDLFRLPNLWAPDNCFFEESENIFLHGHSSFSSQFSKSGLRA